MEFLMSPGRVDGAIRQTCVMPRVVPARAVQKACLAAMAGGRRYVLTDTKVVGALDLSEAVLDHSLRFVRCELTDVFDLRGTRAEEGIRFADCGLRSVLADRLHVVGDLVFEQVRVSRTVSLCGASVDGHLRCTGSSFLAPGEKVFNAKGMVVGGSVLFEDGCVMNGEFVAEAVRVGGTVDLTGATLSNAGGRAVAAKGIRTGVDLLMAGVHAEGEVCLDGGVIAGELSCSDATFTNKGRTALRANGISAQSMWLNDGFVANGSVQLFGATIPRELNCSHGVFASGAGSDALMLDGLVAGKVFLDSHFRASGKVCLRNARIATELNFSKGTFENGGHHAIEAGGLRCDGDVYLNQGFTAIGKVALQDAEIRRNLNCAEGRFDTFQAQRLSVGGTFDWRPHRTPDVVDVSFATVGLLRDRLRSWPAGTCLTGLTIKSIDDEEMSAGERMSWLEGARGYAPEVYQQLMRIYRQCGKIRDSYQVAISNQDQRRARGDLPKWAWLWSWFLGWSVGYGYRLYRPLVVLLITAAVGTVLFWLAKANDLMIPVAAGPGAVVDAGTCTVDYPCFAPWTYAFELFLPVVNLRQVNYWLPDATTLGGRLLFAYVWLAVITGWLASVGIVAGIGQLINQRD